MTTPILPLAGSPRRRRRRSAGLHPLTPGRVVAVTLAWMYGALLALPLLYLILSSLKNNTEIFTNGFALPPEWRWENYAMALRNAGLGPAILNSTLVVLGAEVIIILLAVPAGYAIARSRGVLGKLIERSLSLGFLIPGFAALVPTVYLSIALGLFRTREFLMLSYAAAALPLSVILIAQYMRAIPKELEESATVDGASRIQVLVRIYIPLVMPVLATVILLNFIDMWNEYLIALVITGAAPDIRTAQVALPTLVTLVSAQYGLLAAGTIISLIPVYLAYIILRRRMENALVSGALKG